jgi:hypothetical protein
MFWNQEKRERENEKLDASLTEIVEAMNNANLLRRVLYISSVGNLLVWIICIIFSDKIVYMSGFLGGITSKPVTIALLILFFLGIFMAYSVFRLKFPDIENNKLLESKFMSSIEYQENSNKRWLI